MADRRLCISFSGGETSARMAQLCVTRLRKEYDQIVTVMANASQEWDETYAFAEQCNEAFGLNLVLVQAVVHFEYGKGSTFQVVDFATADRTGKVFEDVIDKYGIPNPAFPHCTRELKANPIRAYLRSIGWEAGSYDTAIGIRIDEIDRMEAGAKEKRIVYPLVSRFPHTKQDVNEFWQRQPFRLELKGYQGNCKWCWKKSLRKHLTIMRETPAAFDFPERMEKEKAHCGAGEGPRVFFRKHRTVADIRKLATEPFTPSEDDARQYQPDMFPQYDEELDKGGSCDDGCEIELGDAA